MAAGINIYGLPIRCLYILTAVESISSFKGLKNDKILNPPTGRGEN